MAALDEVFRAHVRRRRFAARLLRPSPQEDSSAPRRPPRSDRGGASGAGHRRRGRGNKRFVQRRQTRCGWSSSSEKLDAARERVGDQGVPLTTPTPRRGTDDHAVCRGPDDPRCATNQPRRRDGQDCRESPRERRRRREDQLASGHRADGDVVVVESCPGARRQHGAASEVKAVRRSHADARGSTLTTQFTRRPPTRPAATRGARSAPARPGQLTATRHDAPTRHPDGARRDARRRRGGPGELDSNPQSRRRCSSRLRRQAPSGRVVLNVLFGNRRRALGAGGRLGRGRPSPRPRGRTSTFGPRRDDNAATDSRPCAFGSRTRPRGLGAFASRLSTARFPGCPRAYTLGHRNAARLIPRLTGAERQVSSSPTRTPTPCSSPPRQVPRAGEVVIGEVDARCRRCVRSGGRGHTDDAADVGGTSGSSPPRQRAGSTVGTKFATPTPPAAVVRVLGPRHATLGHGHCGQVTSCAAVHLASDNQLGRSRAGRR